MHKRGKYCDHPAFIMLLVFFVLNKPLYNNNLCFV